ncbi:hypothetical protein HUU05_24330 [candidate division KSB1 bacterium]|nr:hypothetical protein [candidate division KSB1 bacterium]
MFLLPSWAWAQSEKQTELRIHALHAEPGRPSVYEVAFTATEKLAPEAEFSFEFPAEFDLTQLQIAGSPDINGGFTLKRDKQKVLVQRSGLGQSIAAGTFVRLRLGAIGNPKIGESSNAIVVQMHTSAQSPWTDFAKQRVVFVRTEKSE